MKNGTCPVSCNLFDSLAWTSRAQLDDCFQRCWRRFEAASPSHALVISWIVQDGLTHQEIGELLGRTPEATREFISQCRERARLHLAEWYELALSAHGRV